MTYGIKKITGTYSDTSDLKIPDLKVLPTNVFVMIWSISVAVFLITLVGLFMVEIIPF